MPELMESTKVTLSVQVSWELRQALKAEANKRGAEMGELLEELLGPALEEAIEEVRSYQVARKKKRD